MDKNEKRVQNMWSYIASFFEPQDWDETNGPRKLKKLLREKSKKYKMKSLNTLKHQQRYLVITHYTFASKSNFLNITVTLH